MSDNKSLKYDYICIVRQPSIRTSDHNNPPYHDQRWKGLKAFILFANNSWSHFIKKLRGRNQTIKLIQICIILSQKGGSNRIFKSSSENGR